MARLSFAITNEQLYQLAQASIRCGFQTRFWQPEAEPMYDMLDRFNPNVLICESSTVNEFDRIALQEFDETQVVFIDQKNLQPFASCLTFYPVDYDETFASDLFYFSKNPSLRFEALDLAEYATENNLRLRIVGPTVIYNCPYYLGEVLSQQTLLKMIASTKIVIDLDGQFALNSALARKFCLSMYNDEIFPLLNDLSEIRKWLDDSVNRADITQQVYEHNINNNTEFHRLTEILLDINETQLADKVLKTLCV